MGICRFFEPHPIPPEPHWPHTRSLSARIFSPLSALRLTAPFCHHSRTRDSAQVSKLSVIQTCSLAKSQRHIQACPKNARAMAINRLRRDKS